MTPPVTSLARDEVRLKDGTIARIKAGDTWIEFEEGTDTQLRSNIVDRFTINDIVTDAVQIETSDEDGETHLGDYEFQSFRDKALAGTLAPKQHVFPDDDTPDATQIAEDIVEAVNSGIDAEELMSEFDSKHNALQQRAFTDVVKPLILALATAPATDRRNENAVESAREIADQMDWETPDHRQ